MTREIEVGDYVQLLPNVTISEQTILYFRNHDEGEVVELNSGFLVLKVLNGNFGWMGNEENSRWWSVSDNEVELADSGSRLVMKVLEDAYEAGGNSSVLQIIKERKGEA